MPEGPEIRRVADRLGTLLVDATLESVWFAFPELQRCANALASSRVQSVDSWGKALLITFADDQVVYSHNQLYGVWKVHAVTNEPQTARVLRLRLSATRHAASLYSASSIELWTRETLDQQPFLARLGPDLLTHHVTQEAIVERLEDARFRRRGLGTLLLDQGFYAGIGNYLRSEILFYAGLGPQTRPQDLDASQRRRLANEVLATITCAYRHAGVTNRAAWKQRQQQAGDCRSQWRHAVFNREGKRCHACGEAIIRSMVASRRLYRCPHCQPEFKPGLS